MHLDMKNTALPDLMLRHKDIFVCPIDGGTLDINANRSVIRCEECGQAFNTESQIPLLFWPNDWDSKTDVTSIIQAFYEENPFPNYEDIDSASVLIEKSRRGIFARLLDEQLPPAGKILEVGCGTGQVSNFLGIRGIRTVFGADACLNSLKLGQEFKEKNSIENTSFIQMNLFRPIFKPESFHLVMCNGVLHHTSDPYLGFKSILKLVKKGGFIIIGLYNKYGRISTDIRRLIFKASGNRFKFLDSRLENKNIDSLQRHTWFMDQYKNPHESKHTFGEILRWFDESGVEFLNSIPKSRAFVTFSENEKLFDIYKKGTWLDRLLIQTGMLIKDDGEGGFFLLVGRKNK